MNSLKEMVFNQMKSELTHIISMVREDYVSDEAKTQANELKALIETQQTEESDAALIKNLKAITALSTIGYYRDWLCEYKGRGYVLVELGNNHCEYRCTVEEFMSALTVSDQRSE